MYHVLCEYTLTGLVVDVCPKFTNQLQPQKCYASNAFSQRQSPFSVGAQGNHHLPMRRWGSTSSWSSFSMVQSQWIRRLVMLRWFTSLMWKVYFILGVLVYPSVRFRLSVQNCGTMVIKVAGKLFIPEVRESWISWVSKGLDLDRDA